MLRRFLKLLTHAGIESIVKLKKSAKIVIFEQFIRRLTLQNASCLLRCKFAIYTKSNDTKHYGRH